MPCKQQWDILTVLPCGIVGFAPAIVCCATMKSRKLPTNDFEEVLSTESMTWGMIAMKKQQGPTMPSGILKDAHQIHQSIHRTTTEVVACYCWCRGGGGGGLRREWQQVLQEVMTPWNIDKYHQLEEIDDDPQIWKDNCRQIWHEGPPNPILCKQEPPQGVTQRDVVIAAPIVQRQ
jgi:hypothetical protein